MSDTLAKAPHPALKTEWIYYLASRIYRKVHTCRVYYRTFNAFYHDDFDCILYFFLQLRDCYLRSLAKKITGKDCGKTKQTQAMKFLLSGRAFDGEKKRTKIYTFVPQGQNREATTISPLCSIRQCCRNQKESAYTRISD